MKKGFRRNSLKYSVNEEFFDKWVSQMAYVLGFTFADGNIYKTSLSWDIQKKDRNVLEKVSDALGSNYPIKEQRGSSYRLRVNNQILIKGAISRGLLPKKSLRLSFPGVPNTFVRHFIRGYLDGDGWISIRNGRNEVDLGFVCGNRMFLSDLSKKIKGEIGIAGRVREKKKITPKGINSTTYLLEYFSSNAMDIADWLYRDLEKNDLYLERKYRKYLRAAKVYNSLWLKYRSKRLLQKINNKSLRNLLVELHNKHLSGMQMARILGTSKSSIYRWLETTGVKYLN